MKKPEKKVVIAILYWILGLLLVMGMPQLLLYLQTRNISYSEFKVLLRQGRVLEVRLGPETLQGIAFTGTDKNVDAIREQVARIRSGSSITGRWFSDRDGQSLQQIINVLKKDPGFSGAFEIFSANRVKDPDLVKELDAHGVIYEGVRESMLGQVLWGTIVPVAFWVGLWFLLVRGMGKPGAGLLSIGKSRARIAVEKDTGVTFDDVAGCVEAKEELEEVVSFLKEPQRYEALGAQIPKGVLLVGPPGTGKTLLARALAGEANVPFYTISGSEFVEMFVGVGAARVRDLFTQAKQNAPCIIFIDEIDAIGKFRGGVMPGGHEEREQTLNQLLVEMDGFEPNIGVILLAATNRPEVLDPALLRPGRFDRQVVLDAPDLKGREAILKVHARGKPLAPDADLHAIAQRTPGFSGADLANIMNEAALLAARNSARQITQEFLEAAAEKVFAGPERKSRRLGTRERRRVAVHEAGHALVAFHCPHAQPVAKISIIPRGKAALGYTLQLPEEESFLMTRSELLDRICVAMGGRAAELEILGEESSGAQNDLETATDIARSMVARFGMSEAIGPVALSRETTPFLRPSGMFGQNEPMSQELASSMDREVRRVLTEQEHRAKNIISQHRKALEEVADRLLTDEVLAASEFEHIVGDGVEDTGE